jgi:uncharacterized membrane protein (UPF0136 family)
MRNRQPYGVELALAASLLLAGSSVPRAVRGRKPVPVVLSLVAVCGLLVFGGAYRRGGGGA